MTTLGRTRVAIVHDHAIFRDALHRLLTDQPDIDVVGTADAGDAIAMVRAKQPDILLLDLVMSGTPALEVLHSLPTGGPPRTVVLTASVDQEQTLEALRLGARGVLSRETTTALLPKCIRVVMSGQYWIGQASVASLVNTLRNERRAEPKGAGRFGLTPRQVQIVRAVATGASNGDIAAELGISEDTVKQHVASIFDKCGVSSRVELAVFAVHHGIVSTK